MRTSSIETVKRHASRCGAVNRVWHQVQLVNLRMAQIVISFGSENLECVKNAIQKAVGKEDFTADVTTARSVEEMTLVPTDESLEAITAKLSAGTITSVCLHMKNRTPIHFVNLFAPNFCGASLSFWQGTIEYKEDTFEILFNDLLSFTCLRYVCAGMEEGPELEQRHMSLETFPFDEEPLMLSAFREDDRTPGWRIRRGPAYPRPNVGHTRGHSETR
jgi:hypothetical protein